MATETAVHQGGCHCGNIKFTFVAPRDATVYACNCSICAMVGYQHLIIPARDFTLVSGEPVVYRFGSGIAQHTFCGTCGIKSWYIPRSNPDGVSVNYRCVDKATFAAVTIDEFDGQNWERNAASLGHLSD